MVEPLYQKRQSDTQTVSETMDPASGQELTGFLVDTEPNVI